MKIVRENILNEEFIGYMKSSGGDYKNISVIKNPTTLKGLSDSIRAVSTYDGDIFYVNEPRKMYDSNVIHSDIIIWMIANGYLHGTLNDFETLFGWNDIVCWQRVGNTDIMKLSESYDIEEMNQIELDNIEEMADEIDKKDITYVLEQI